MGMHPADISAAVKRLRLATRHPKRVTAIVIRNGNAYVQGVSKDWAPLGGLLARANA